MELSQRNNEPVMLYVFYNPSGSCSANLSLLDDSQLSNPQSSFIVGDFNVPLITRSDSFSTPVNSGGCAGGLFSELIDYNFRFQFIKGPTQHAGNNLDLLLFDVDDMISKVLASPSYAHNFPTDHHIIEFTIHTKFERSNFVEPFQNHP